MAAIALLHPFPFGPPIMAPQAEALRAAGHQVIVPDLWPQTPIAPAARPVLPGPEGLRRAEAAGQTGQVAVAGLSSAAMSRWPCWPTPAPGRRPGAHGHEGRGGRRRRGGRSRGVCGAGRGRGMAWVPSATPGLLGETTREQRPDIVEQVRQWILASDPAAVAWTQRAMAARPDSLPVLAARGNSGVGPSLVLVGAEDTLAAGAGPADGGGAGRCTVGRAAGAGHLTAVECPKRCPTVWSHGPRGCHDPPPVRIPLRAGACPSASRRPGGVGRPGAFAGVAHGQGTTAGTHARSDLACPHPHPPRAARGAGPSRPMGYVPALDGVRAVAVLGVLVYHGSASWIPGASWAWTCSSCCRAA